MRADTSHPGPYCQRNAGDPRSTARRAGSCAARLLAIRQALTVAGQIALTVRLLTGGVGAPIAWHGGNPTATDRTAINTAGQGGAFTCHCSGSAQASFICHANHNPPLEIAMTVWFPAWLAGLQQTPLVLGLRATLANSAFWPQ